MKVLLNGRIYTSNTDMPTAEAAVISGKEIKYIGNRQGAEKFIPEAEVVDLKGQTVLPGMIDSHIHPAACTGSLWHVKLPWTQNVDELLDFVKKYAEAHPKEEEPFIYFEYYPTSMFDEHGPTKEMLDSAVSDRPVLCQDFGEHLCWVNSKMLELLGVDKNTQDPSRLESFVRDDEGNPTGWIKEMAWLHFADNMYKKIDWYPPKDITPETMESFFCFMEECGITALFDGFIESDQQIEALYQLDKAGKLHTYYDGSVRFWEYKDLPEKIAKLREYQEKYTTEHIKINTMKLFLDGTNESGNSASLYEHINDPGNYGEIMMETAELTDCLILCNKEGLDLHIHMVGDRAFRVGCDAVESAKKIAEAQGVPWICKPVFAHCELVDPLDMHRPAELGISINWSCHWSGGYFGEEAIRFYGEEKWNRMYQFNTMLNSGADVAFSSDVVTGYELHRAYPFFGMQVAATRVDPEFPLDPDKYPGSMRPEEDAKLSVETLMEGYTLKGAKQLRWEDIMGSLETGKVANMIVVDKDPMTVSPDRLKDIEVRAVIFDGSVIRGAI